jgi:hypothetical protein
MKQIQLMVILFSIAIVSCSKNDEDPIEATTNSITMKINGTLWTGSVLNNNVDIDAENLTLNSISVATSETFGFTIEHYKGIGTYPTSGDDFTSAFHLRKDKVIFSAGKELTYKITNEESTTANKKAHGIFSGTMKSTSGEVLTITEGKF